MQSLENGPTEAAAPLTAAGRYLTFFVAEEEYAFEVHRVREILGQTRLTPVPKAHHTIRGVLNRRGEVIPVLDLRARLGLEEVADTDESCIIILTIGSTPIGVAVDRVADVLDISEGDISAPSELLTAENDDFLVGFAKTENGLKLLLDADQILGHLHDEVIGGETPTPALVQA